MGRVYPPVYAKSGIHPITIRSQKPITGIFSVNQALDPSIFPSKWKAK